MMRQGTRTQSLGLGRFMTVIALIFGVGLLSLAPGAFETGRIVQDGKPETVTATLLSVERDRRRVRCRFWRPREACYEIDLQVVLEGGAVQDYEVDYTVERLEQLRGYRGDQVILSRLPGVSKVMELRDASGTHVLVPRSEAVNTTRYSGILLSITGLIVTLFGLFSAYLHVREWRR